MFTYIILAKAIPGDVLIRYHPMILLYIIVTQTCHSFLIYDRYIILFMKSLICDCISCKFLSNFPVMMNDIINNHVAVGNTHCRWPFETRTGKIYEFIKRKLILKKKCNQARIRFVTYHRTFSILRILGYLQSFGEIFKIFNYTCGRLALLTHFTRIYKRTKDRN